MQTKIEGTSTRWLFRAFPPPTFLMMPAFGLDISDTSIRYVELHKRRNEWELGKFGTQSLPEGLMRAGKIEKPQELSKEFEKLRKEQGLHYVRVSLPEEYVYLFQTTIPSTLSNISEIRNAIEFQLEEHVPLQSHEAVFDFEVTERHGDEMNVNVGVYADEIVRSYVDVLRGAGLTPLSFEIESAALARAVVPETQGTYLVVDFGRRRTGIAIVSNGTLRFTSTISVGGDTLTTDVQKFIELSEDEITNLKNKKGITRMNDNEELVASMMKTVESLCSEVKRHYEYWNTRVHNTNGSHDIEHIILCGGSSNLAGLTDHLAFNLNTPVSVANVWTNVFSFADYIPPIDKRKSLGYAAALGLALNQ